ncbi:hypothetical protein EC843_1011160 [Buttiauxella sp. JUb87]|uniref:hypothetical protein n=1 Tax=Buttiauxella sp. JUb87 TaxID=2485129 RepID=UPI00105F19B0|nr:hypothetical protein [Buttiauxella sp. JUb87]TDN55097.1 hypothetical protein EC843_1011160 [Buttiauxella sp. JUb87]
MNYKHVAFTIIAENYLAYALTLKNSFETQNPEVQFNIIIADGISNEIKNYSENNDIKLLDALDIEPIIFNKMAFYYDVTEYCTAIKPFMLKHFLDAGYDTVTYIDPDIYFYNSLYDNVLKHLSDHSVFLTPHICSPIKDALIPAERTHLLSGTYNLGFISIANDANALALVKWWMDKCRYECFDEQSSGLFVDQKWINLVPGLFEGVYISRHLGLNVAYWNIHERKLNGFNKVNDKYDLVFYHFSGIRLNDLNSISKHQNRFSLDIRPDLRNAFEQYKNEVESKINSLPSLPNYKFSTYSNGKRISLLARRAYFVVQDSFSSPFNSEIAQNLFFDHLQILKIKEKNKSNEIIDKKSITNNLSYLSKIMKIVLRVLGPYRYISLVKAFRYLAGLSNCDFLYKK